MYIAIKEILEICISLLKTSTKYKKYQRNNFPFKDSQGVNDSTHLWLTFILF